MDRALDPVEGRVLGSLLEKQRTVPDTYPLTMRALVTACNQATSREPVMGLTVEEVEHAVESLKAAKLVRRVLPSHGSRVAKYRQVADELWSLDDAQTALLAVLLLRGPQTAAELRARADRLHPMPDVAAVEDVLAEMAGWDRPFVRRLPRRPGQRDARWAQLVGQGPDDDREADPPAGGGTRSGSRVGEDGPAPPDPADPTLHGPLLELVGRWRGTGEGRYPSISDFTYTQEIVIAPLPGKPVLTYSSRTRAADDGGGLHAESGFLRLTGPGAVELVVAAAPGIIEACRGAVETAPGVTEVVLSSEHVSGTSSAKAVAATARTYTASGDELSYDIAMATGGHPLTHHLRAVLRRT